MSDLEIGAGTYKLIIAGPVGAGKTQAIRSLSDKGVVTTEEIASDGVGKIKKPLPLPWIMG